MSVFLLLVAHFRYFAGADLQVRAPPASRDLSPDLFLALSGASGRGPIVRLSVGYFLFSADPLGCSRLPDIITFTCSFLTQSMAIFLAPITPRPGY